MVRSTEKQEGDDKNVSGRKSKTLSPDAANAISPKPSQSRKSKSRANTPALEKFEEDEEIYKYVKGETVICEFSGSKYEAKILDIVAKENIDRKNLTLTKTNQIKKRFLESDNLKEPLYFVHYNGWNKKWDEWVEEDRMEELSGGKKTPIKKPELVQSKSSTPKTVVPKTPKETTGSKTQVVHPMPRLSHVAPKIPKKPKKLVPQSGLSNQHVDENLSDEEEVPDLPGSESEEALDRPVEMSIVPSTVSEVVPEISIKTKTPVPKPQEILQIISPPVPVEPKVIVRKAEPEVSKSQEIVVKSSRTSVTPKVSLVLKTDARVVPKQQEIKSVDKNYSEKAPAEKPFISGHTINPREKEVSTPVQAKSVVVNYKPAVPIKKNLPAILRKRESVASVEHERQRHESEKKSAQQKPIQDRTSSQVKRPIAPNTTTPTNLIGKVFDQVKKQKLASSDEKSNQDIKSNTVVSSSLEKGKTLKRIDPDKLINQSRKVSATVTSSIVQVVKQEPGTTEPKVFAKKSSPPQLQHQEFPKTIAEPSKISPPSEKEKPTSFPSFPLTLSDAFLRPSLLPTPQPPSRDVENWLSGFPTITKEASKQITYVKLFDPDPVTRFFPPRPSFQSTEIVNTVSKDPQQKPEVSRATSTSNANSSRPVVQSGSIPKTVLPNLAKNIAESTSHSRPMVQNETVSIKPAIAEVSKPIQTAQVQQKIAAESIVVKTEKVEDKSLETIKIKTEVDPIPGQSDKTPIVLTTVGKSLENSTIPPSTVPIQTVDAQKAPQEGLRLFEFPQVQCVNVFEKDLLPKDSKVDKPNKSDSSRSSKKRSISSSSSSEESENSSKKKIKADKKNKQTPDSKNNESLPKDAKKVGESLRRTPTESGECLKSLEEILLFDSNQIKEHNMLIKTVPPVSIEILLKNYVAYVKKTIKNHGDRVKASLYANGLRDLIAATLGMQLMYDEEREIYTTTMNRYLPDVEWSLEKSKLFAPIYLLRLLTKIEKLQDTFDDEGMNVLREEKKKFLTYLHKNRQMYFPESFYYCNDDSGNSRTNGKQENKKGRNTLAESDSNASSYSSSSN